MIFYFKSGATTDCKSFDFNSSELNFSIVMSNSLIQFIANGRQKLNISYSKDSGINFAFCRRMITHQTKLRRSFEFKFEF